MNQRIQELFEQSRVGPGLGHDMEKFAKLIIRDCMELNREILTDDDPYHLGVAYSNHFGIEDDFL